MALIMKVFKFSFLLIVSMTATLATVGCGNSSGPDPKVEQVRVDQAVEMRKLFDSVGGDYAKLDAASKAKFEKYVGGTPADAEKTWASMKYGSGADASNQQQGARSQ
jgi:hypothetical protein